MGVWTIVILLTVVLLVAYVLYSWRQSIKNLKVYNVKNFEKILPPDLKIESFFLTTSDGYALQLFNIRSTLNFNPDLEPVLMQHPVGSSALSWLICEEKSPGIVLAKLGCDVYLANSRGNAYSLGHDTLNIDSYKYWDFSWQEMALDC